jgi:mannose-1-phosphate guanylyltransferase
LHYVEKPETFISDLISCGVYLFDSAVFSDMKRAIDIKKETEDDYNKGLSLERDLLRPLSQEKKLYIYRTTDFWKQIKTSGSAIAANAAYLQLYQSTNKGKLAMDKPGGPEIIGPVFIHPSSQVDPTAKVCSFFKNMKHLYIFRI